MKKDVLLAECIFKAVRSSGPGGQHVNKTSSKVVLRWDLTASQAFDDEQKSRLLDKLANKLTKDNVLVINNEQSRSQHKNKEAAIQQFFHILKSGLQRQKRRKKTKPSRISKLKRLNSKKRHAEKKTNRKPPKL